MYGIINVPSAGTGNDSGMSHDHGESDIIIIIVTSDTVGFVLVAFLIVNAIFLYKDMRIEKTMTLSRLSELKDLVSFVNTMIIS